MKNSLKIRMVIVLMALLSSTMIFLIIINIAFLEKYYEGYKIKNLGNAFLDVNEMYKDNDLEQIPLKLEQLSSKQNVSLYVFKSYNYSLGTFLEIEYPLNMSEEQIGLLQNGMAHYLRAGLKNKNESKLIYKVEKYSILKHFDSRLETNYLELFGKLDNGFDILIRSNYENITESVTIANRFFIYVGVAAVLMGSMIMYLIGVNFTKPIKKLSEITKEISDLKFDVKYKEEREDEIGDLGRSVNLLSEKLKVAISDLKFANNELKNDIRQKEREDALRKEFLSNITHELKTPIALIQGYAEGLKANINETEEDRDFYHDVIIDEANKMNIMVKKLLNLNQIELGMSKPEFERFNVVSLIQSVVNSMDMLFKGIQTDCVFEEKRPIFVWADEFLVEEVLTNYITNAIHHVAPCNKGEKMIMIRVKESEDKLKISVFNTGKPIPEEDIGRIWDKFYKVDKARTREYGGSGIGLSIVKAIMESLNRGYGVTNWDNGVEFWFELDVKA